jgi:lysylphosphatidylglycerol synthetase-like protein (DUF2156 family)
MAQTLTESAATLQRQRLIEIVRKWGDVNTDGLLDESCKLFSIPDVEGLIGYKIESSNAIVLGDPVCAPEEKSILATAFQNYCESQKWGVVYTIASQEFADFAVENMSATSIEFGDKFIFDPQNNPLEHSGHLAVLVRKKVKHAAKEGITVKEYLQHDPDIEQGISEVANTWLQKRHGPQIFLTRSNLFNDRQGKRYFYAERKGKIIGLLMLNAMEAKKGWMLNNLMIIQGTPSGLSELLVVAVLQAIAEEDCRYAAVGPLVGKELGKITGLNEINATFIRWLFKLLKLVFRLDGQTTFWAKFPHAIEGCYLVFPKNNLGFSSIKALLQAFNVGKS